METQNREVIKLRKKANFKILTRLGQIIDQYPYLRFQQILAIYKISEPYEDKFYEESVETQIYKVLEQVKSPYDSNGTQVKFRVIDQDYDKGFLRLRVENNGNSQIYVDYADISWVYNVVRTRQHY